MVETVLVTGGTGFVGGWCIVALLRSGYAVRTTVRTLAKEPALRAAVGVQAGVTGRLSVVVADLTDDAGWDAAVAGCDYVLHVASPLGGANDATLIAAAKDGALRVLGASIRAGVRRVILTSSTAASAPSLKAPDSLNDETVWTDPDDPTLTAYRRSKVLAERAAWDVMAREGGDTEFATILPTAIFGPVLSSDTQGSVQVIAGLMTGRMPGNPRRGFNIVDVRDLADAHIRAMTSTGAAGQRFIACSDFMWMADISRTLRASLGERAAKVPTRNLPSFVLRLAARFDPSARTLVPGLDRRHAFTSAKAQQVLDWRPRPAAQTVVDCAESLIAHGMV